MVSKAPAELLFLPAHCWKSGGYQNGFWGQIQKSTRWFPEITEPAQPGFCFELRVLAGSPSQIGQTLRGKPNSKAAALLGNQRPLEGGEVKSCIQHLSSPQFERPLMQWFRTSPEATFEIRGRGRLKSEYLKKEFVAAHDRDECHGTYWVRD
jgi:hypothetical protein